jgi:hypothetical protein
MTPGTAIAAVMIYRDGKIAIGFNDRNVPPADFVAVVAITDIGAVWTEVGPDRYLSEEVKKG